MGKRIVLICIIVVVVVTLLSSRHPRYTYGEPSAKSVAAKVEENQKQSTFAEAEEFVFSCLDEIHQRYVLGNNMVIEGQRETQISKNKAGEIVEVNVSYKLYEAKGIFEKMEIDCKRLKMVNDETATIRNLLCEAAHKRIDAIDLFTKGCYLKEQIGKTVRTNAESAMMSGGAALPLPQYDGGIENSLGVSKTADALVVDALFKIRLLIDKTELPGTVMHARIIDTIVYFSDVSSDDYDALMKEGKLDLELKHYFDAAVAYQLALKIRPNDENSLINLAKAFEGLGDPIRADEVINNLKKEYPANKEIGSGRKN